MFGDRLFVLKLADWRSCGFLSFEPVDDWVRVECKGRKAGELSESAGEERSGEGRKLSRCCIQEERLCSL